MADERKDRGAGYTDYFEHMKKVCEEDRSHCNDMINSIAEDYCCSSLCSCC